MESTKTSEAIEDKSIDLDDSLEERLVFYECLPTLQQIACHEIALKLWHHYIAYDKSKKVREKTEDLLRMAYSLDENYRNESDKLVTFLNLPRRIEEMLKKSLDTIRVEMETWIRYCKGMFEGRLIMYSVRDFNPIYCVWFQNGEMDYKKTASKMLTFAELTHEQKFAIMCFHGMADDIKKFPLSALSEDFKQRSIFENEISYWTFLCKINYTEFLRELASRWGREEFRKSDVIMALLCSMGSYAHAFEYFWNQLDEADQITVASRVIPVKWQLQKIILSKMSLYQQREVMSKIPAILMLHFLLNLDMPENAFKVWLHAKDLITEEEFEELITVSYHGNISSENSIRVLIDIWDTASNRLKDYYVADTEIYIIFKSFLVNEQRTPSSSKFVCRLLSLSSARTRKQLILDYAYLIDQFIGDHNFLVDILELCLPTDAEKMELKNKVMKSPIMSENCVKLINSLEYDKLNRKLAFYLPNDRLTRELIKELLISNKIEVKIFMLDYDKWNKLSNFILEIFSNDSSTVSELKKKFISSFSTDAIHYWNKSDNFSEMVKVVEQELSLVELEAYKQTLFKNFQKCVITRKQFWQYFDAGCFNTFVVWCLGDEKKVQDFKKIVPVDEIFDNDFGNICGWNAINGSDYEPHHLLSKLDEFLRCFCASREEVMKFKIRKFNELKQHSFRETWLNCGDRAWYSVLMWFFEIKQEEIVEFQSNDMRKRRKLDFMGRFQEC